MMIAYVNSADKLHPTATRLFEKILNGEIRGIAIPASAYLEYEIVLRSKGYPPQDIIEDIEAFQAIKQIKEKTLTAHIIALAASLRQKHDISYFDSLHAATALTYDKTIISVDKDYRKIPQLNVINPRKI